MSFSKSSQHNRADSLPPARPAREGERSLPRCAQPRSLLPVNQRDSQGKINFFSLPYSPALLCCNHSSSQLPPETTPLLWEVKEKLPGDVHRWLEGTGPFVRQKTCKQSANEQPKTDSRRPPREHSSRGWKRPTTPQTPTLKQPEHSLAAAKDWEPGAWEALGQAEWKRGRPGRVPGTAGETLRCPTRERFHRTRNILLGARGSCESVKPI